MRYSVPYLAIVVLLSGASAAAQSPVLPIQGTLREAAGNLVNDTRSVTFRLYNEDTGGTAFYMVTKDVRFTNGQFVAYLGDQGDEALDPADFDGLPQVWLGIEVSPETVEMTPRVRLGTSPFALYAQMCGEAQSAVQAQSATTATTANMATTANTATTATTATTANTANNLSCAGCVSFSELDSSTRSQIDAAADDVNCSGCVDSDDIDYVVYRGPNTISQNRVQTTSTTTACGPEINAKFCAVAFTSVSQMIDSGTEIQCFVTRVAADTWSVCARSNGTSLTACAMNCLQ